MVLRLFASASYNTIYDFFEGAVCQLRRPVRGRHQAIACSATFVEVRNSAELKHRLVRPVVPLLRYSECAKLPGYTLKKSFKCASLSIGQWSGMICALPAEKLLLMIVAVRAQAKFSDQ